MMHHTLHHTHVPAGFLTRTSHTSEHTHNVAFLSRFTGGKGALHARAIRLGTHTYPHTYHLCVLPCCTKEAKLPYRSAWAYPQTYHIICVLPCCTKEAKLPYMHARSAWQLFSTDFCKGVPPAGKPSIAEPTIKKVSVI